MRPRPSSPPSASSVPPRLPPCRRDSASASALSSWRFRLRFHCCPSFPLRFGNRSTPCGAHFPPWTFCRGLGLWFSPRTWKHCTEFQNLSVNSVFLCLKPQDRRLNNCLREFWHRIVTILARKAAARDVSFELSSNIRDSQASLQALPLSGRTMQFDGGGRCVAGCN